MSPHEAGAVISRTLQTGKQRQENAFSPLVDLRVRELGSQSDVRGYPLDYVEGTDGHPKVQEAIPFPASLLLIFNKENLNNLTSG